MNSIHDNTFRIAGILENSSEKEIFGGIAIFLKKMKRK